MAHASSWMNLPLALLIFLLWGVVLGSPLSGGFDYRIFGKVTPVKNQGGGCDNSWAFAAVSVVESALLIKNFSTDGGLDLSEQQVLDCGSYPRDSFGCYKATVYDALLFIMTRGGLSRERDYPLYTGLNTGICLQQRGSNVSTQGLRLYPWYSRDEDALAHELIQHGPVAVTICLQPQLVMYRGGIYYNRSCPGICSNPIIMTLVGYGTQGGIPYWILKNSWGRAWGEDGYFRLARGSNLCGIATNPYYYFLA